jgi:hypothetical protein
MFAWDAEVDDQQDEGQEESTYGRITPTSDKG